MKKSDGVLTEVLEEDLELLYSNPSKFWKGVKSIGPKAFEQCPNIETLKIPNGVKTIEGRAFSLCYSLKHVELPQKLKKIDYAAFLGCRSLEEIEIPKNIKTISMEVFKDCSNLKKITLPKNVKTIEDGAFAGCESLEELDLPKGLKVIPPRMLKGCKNLKKITLPKKVKIIEDKAFAGCESLEEIYLPKGLKTISMAMFSGCKSLKTITIPKGVKTIEHGAFAGCESLEEIEIPKKVSKIEFKAFQNCKKLKSINIPESVRVIGDQAFYGCDNVEKITFPSRVHNLSNTAFELIDDMYISKGGNKFLITKEEPKDLKLSYSEKVKDCLGFSRCLSYAVKNINKTSNPIAKEDEELNEYLMKNSIRLPYPFIKELKEGGQVENFINNTRLKNFKRILTFAPNSFSDEEIVNFCTFAHNIGCFSQDKEFNNCANTWLESKITNEQEKNRNLSLITDTNECGKWKISEENREFSEFLFNKNLNNFDQLADMERGPLIMRQIYQEYANPEKALLEGGRYRDEKTGKLMFRIARQTQNQQGESIIRPKNLKPTLELFINYLSPNLFDGIVTEEDKNIAKELARWNGMRQEEFEDAKEIMNEQKKKAPSPNIVGKRLEGIYAEIDAYKAKSESLIKESLGTAIEITHQMGKIADSEFTYEWLEKNDPKNLVLGLYCDCCASLSGAGYGIMRASIIHPDCQNLVVKDKLGNPVAKSTVYVNRTERYAVFNNVEVSHAVDDKKEEIYKAYMAGVKNFAEEYNKQNPNQPLRKINVGENLNDLQQQIASGGVPSDVVLEAINFGEYGRNGNRYEGDWNGKQSTIWESEESISKGR